MGHSYGSRDALLYWAAMGLLVLQSLVLLAVAEETVEDAAILARKLVDYSPTSIGTMATLFPDGHDLAGQAFPLQEYYASCFTNGSLALLFLPISRHSQNIIHSPSHSASISIWSEPLPKASRARVSLIGNVTVFDSDDQIDDVEALQACYLRRHPDARGWLPDSPRAPHLSYWARFDPQAIYYVGGFGSEHYIGYIPLNLYQEALASTMGPVGVAGRFLVQTGQMS